MPSRLGTVGMDEADLSVWVGCRCRGDRIGTGVRSWVALNGWSMIFFFKSTWGNVIGAIRVLLMRPVFQAVQVVVVQKVFFGQTTGFGV